MRRRLLLALLVPLAAGVAWWQLRPPEPAPEAERTFEEIPKDEYEAWMQELGYTE